MRKEYSIIFYYSRFCGSCKGYKDVVEKLSKALDIEVIKKEIGDYKPLHDIEGIPCVILERNGVELYRSVGNLGFQQLYKDIKDYV